MSWQLRGHERGSVVKDPRFVDAANNDFNVHADSPAVALGFKPLDLTRGVGHEIENFFFVVFARQPQPATT